MEKLDYLQTFVQVVRAHSFTAAAKKLSMPRSTVSLHIRSLEESLGVRLLKRSTRALSLTDDGRLLFERVEAGLETLQNAFDQVRNAHGNLSGLIRMTAPTDFPTSVLAQAIDAFRKDHPAVFFDLVLTNAALNLIGEDVDIALRIGDRGDLDRVERKLTEVTWCFYASPQWIDRNDLPTRLEDLQDFISPPEDLRAFFERFVLKERKLPMGIITADNHFLIRDLVAAGAGVGLLPEGICKGMTSEGILTPVIEDAISRSTQLNITFPSRADITPRVRAFSEVLVAQMRHGSHAFED